jgi:hypothetical protein
MATNTIVLIIVAAMSALVLAGMLVAVACKTRTQQRHGQGASIRDQAEEHALQRRADSPQHQATAYRSEAVTSRDQLNELRVHRLAG